MFSSCLPPFFFTFLFHLSFLQSHRFIFFSLHHFDHPQLCDSYYIQQNSAVPMNQNISENIPTSAQFLKITLIGTLTLCSVVKQSESRGGEFSFRNSGRRRCGEEGGGEGGGVEGGRRFQNVLIRSIFYIVRCWNLGRQCSIYSFPHTCLANLNNTVNINHQPAYNTVML